jgi:predicted HTH transcriptional regulator
MLTIYKRIQELSNENTENKLIHSSLKSICAFANTSGGFLLIGVGDDKNIFGLEKDYNRFREKNRDSFGKLFDQKVNEYFGAGFGPSLKKEFLKFPEGDILIIEVSKQDELIFIKKNENGEISDDLYVRNLSSSEKLKGSELAKFIKNKLSQNSNAI